MKQELNVVFESKLVLSFTLPGTRFSSVQSVNASPQLETTHHQDGYRLETTAENALETAQVLRALALEIERVARASK